MGITLSPDGNSQVHRRVCKLHQVESCPEASNILAQATVLTRESQYISERPGSAQVACEQGLTAERPRTGGGWTTKSRLISVSQSGFVFFLETPVGPSHRRTPVLRRLVPPGAGPLTCRKYWTRLSMSYDRAIWKVKGRNIRASRLSRQIGWAPGFDE